MTTPVITVENLSKRYLIGHQSDGSNGRVTNLRDAIMRTSRNLGRKTLDVLRGRDVLQGDKIEEFWALRDLNFQVNEGEVLGIIGRNGAGKSTLLKVLSRITEPTSGRVTIRGRVASLLEVGTGFHPELSGRENVYLNGAILGMTRADIRKRFDEIVAFSEVERFLDTPVKRYSSGMYVRLAFAVAAHLEPEILIVDEVLAVGDIAFQNKCMGKMSSVARESRTVLFVSHNMGAIKSLTKRAILLDQGSIAAEGGSEPVISAYLMKTLDDKKKALKAKDLEPFRRGEKREGPAKIVAIHVPAQGQDAEMLPEIALGSEFSIEICLQVTQAVAAADLCIILFNADGERVTTLVASDQGTGLSLRPGERIVTVDVHGLYLTPGSYYAEIWLDPMIDGRSCDAIFEYPLLTVVNKGLITHGLERPWGSVFCKAAAWRVEDTEAAAPGALTL